MQEQRAFDKGRPETTRGIRAHDASNTMQLSAKQWLGLVAFMIVFTFTVPAIWPGLEKLNFDANYRIPFELSNDYWLYDRLTREAAARCDTLVVGDSVVWGQYVKRNETLSHFLNERAGRERFANLGLDGAHPVALAGLLEHYASGIRDKTVLLECNLLWLSSPQRDLQEKKEFDFNHPALVPQFSPKIPCYKTDVPTRLGNIVDRNSAFNSWTHHLQQAYFGHSTIPEWTLEHPYENPARAITMALPEKEKKPRHASVPWTEQGITAQNFPWVDLQASLQWKSFLRAAEILQRRNNHVIVFVSPFNEHMLTPESRERFTKLKIGIETSLRENKIDFIAPNLLPSEMYADASHPLAGGYKKLAEQLLASGTLQ